MLPALSSGWIYKKQYDVLVDMKKTRMSPELKYAQPPVQTLLTLCASHTGEACHLPLYNKSEESMHRRFSYAMYKLSINCLQIF